MQYTTCVFIRLRVEFGIVSSVNLVCSIGLVSDEFVL